MTESNTVQFNEFENPLLWPILSILKNSNESWKVHTLADHLVKKMILLTLDEDSTKDLFKRNFLIMNALFQLQELVSNEYFLQVESMDIKLIPLERCGSESVISSDALKDYYTDWRHYEASAGEVKKLLNDFWDRYRRNIGTGQSIGTYTDALKVLGLDEHASKNQIRKRWRELALKWHPDRKGGNSETFTRMCEAWSVLKEKAR
ncbi:DNA-J related domain-containing protein [Vibrio maerlii]|uniref:DNA-J related domain-containing protein n=1 Tax=Vibrio maerlii TaxID=2231648 RepID=UPI001F13F1C7|nr:DNA-J related domain-containing protein [Vibrio maerlii]